MQEGDTLAYNLSGESARGLWAQIDQKNYMVKRLLLAFWFCIDNIRSISHFKKRAIWVLP